MKENFISVIIATHNSASTIEFCIKSLNSQNYDKGLYEIIVIDDGSNDDSKDIAKKTGADKVISVPSCTLGKARNIGVENSTGEFLAFLDSDIVVSKNWLESIRRELKNYDAISGPIENGKKDSLVAWAEYLMEFSEFNEFKSKEKIRFMPGCNQSCKRTAFDRTVGFPDLKISDDVYFGNLLKENNIGIYFIPDLKVSHLGTTNFRKYLSKMKLLGKYARQTRIENQTISHARYMKNKWSVPIVFFGKLWIRAKFSIKAKKFTIYLKTFPLIFLGIIFFCKGILDDSENK